MTANYQADEKRIKKAMSLWGQYGRRYRTLKGDYRRLLRRINKLRIIPYKLSKDALDEWPRIPFLLIEDENEALAYLHELRSYELKEVIDKMEDLRYNYSYNTLTAFVNDYGYRVRTHGSPKTPFGYDPEFRNGSVHSTHRTPVSDD